VIAPDARGRTTAALTLAARVRVTLPIVLHRPLPAGKLARAYILVTRVGERYVWGLRVVVQPDESRARRRGTGSCAVNFGWRMTPAGVRIAVAVGDHGTHELVIPQHILTARRHAEHIRAIADAEAHAYLGDTRKRAKARRRAMHTHPMQAAPDTRRAPWVNAVHWARQDRHLNQWERDEIAKAIRRRRAIVLAWVQSLAALYDSVTVEAYSLAALIRRDRPTEIPEAPHVRFIVAPGELRARLKAEFGPERVTCLRGEMTLPHVCGGRLVGDRARDLVLTCERCGARVDQDVNNAENQLAAAAAE
jgi:hypothetical protein